MPEGLQAKVATTRDFRSAVDLIKRWQDNDPVNFKNRASGQAELADVIAVALESERERVRAAYERWLTELHRSDGNYYCVECERPTPNGCTTILELPRIRHAVEADS